jgi:hypothetical protein
VRVSYASISRLLGLDWARLYKPNEAVDVRAVGEESDDIALVVDAIDDGPRHAKRGRLARSRGVEFIEIASIKNEAMCCTLRIHKGADDEVIATTEGLCALGARPVLDPDFEGV